MVPQRSVLVMNVFSAFINSLDKGPEHTIDLCSRQHEFTGVQGYKPKQPWKMEKQLGKAKHKKLIKTNCKILPLGKNNQLCKPRMRNLFSYSSEKDLGTTHSALVKNILHWKRERTHQAECWDVSGMQNMWSALSTMAGTDRTSALLMYTRILIARVSKQVQKNWLELEK